MRGDTHCAFVLQIVGDVPWLGATVERVPDKLLDGQVIRCTRSHFCELFPVITKRACFFCFCQVCWLLLRLQNRGTASIDCKSLFGFCRFVGAISMHDLQSQSSLPHVSYSLSDPGMVLGTAWRVDDDTDAMEDTSRYATNDAQNSNLLCCGTPKNPALHECAILTNQNAAMESRRILFPSFPHLYFGEK